MGLTVHELRAMALALPEVEEKGHMGHPDFRVRNKIVVNLDEEARTTTIKVGLDDQAALVATDPQTFSLAGGWAKYGWTTIHLDHVDADELDELLRDVWLRVAPKKLHALLEDEPGQG